LASRPPRAQPAPQPRRAAIGIRNMFRLRCTGSDTGRLWVARSLPPNLRPEALTSNRGATRPIDTKARPLGRRRDNPSPVYHAGNFLLCNDSGAGRSRRERKAPCVRSCQSGQPGLRRSCSRLQRSGCWEPRRSPCPGRTDVASWNRGGRGGLPPVFLGIRQIDGPPGSVALT
jgi:hypothetical protein